MLTIFFLQKATQCGAQVLLNNLSTVYATVDKSKKIKNRQPLDEQSSFEMSQSSNSEQLHRSPYDEKISNEKPNQDSSDVNTNTGQPDQNYMNFDFVKSLEFYENSKDLMQKSCQVKRGNKTDESKSVGTNTTPQTPDSGVKICTKCRHECKWPPPNSGNKQDDYLMMEPSGSENSIRTSDHQVSSCRHVPGYLPMHPIGSSTMSNQDLLRLKLYQQQVSGHERASSSPSLIDNSDKCRKRFDVEVQRAGTSMFGFNQSISAANSPYLRRRVLGCLHESAESETRKRACSADSANNLHESRLSHQFVSSSDSREERQYEDNVKHPKKTVDFNMETITLNESERNSSRNISSLSQEPSVSKEVEYENIQTIKSNEPLVHVRRSSSAPSKSNHNRDSSSSNDSGVSSCSLKKQSNFAADVKPASSSTGRRYTYTTTDKDLLCKCFHSSLPRRSKSVDPLRDLAFQFQKVDVPMKSSSAEAEVPLFHAKRDSRGMYLFYSIKM